jgi:alpha-mannosidase
MDQGENLFRFWINAGPVEERFDTVEAEALARNEKPMALSFFPSGAGLLPKAFITLSDTRVQVATIKKAEEGNGLVLRLFEPTGRKRTTRIRLPFAKMEKEITLKPFEIRTYHVDIRKRTWTAVDLLERPVADE